MHEQGEKQPNVGSKTDSRAKVGSWWADKWLTQYGHAWVSASDLLGGPFLGTTNIQQVLRALDRAGIAYERMQADGRSYLYRLTPEA